MPLQHLFAQLNTRAYPLTVFVLPSPTLGLITKITKHLMRSRLPGDAPPNEDMISPACTTNTETSEPPLIFNATLTQIPVGHN